MKFPRIFLNQISVFLVNRYISYALLFIRGILIAKFLGPYYFGVWGFLTLSLQYLAYSNFGINYAITVYLSKEEDRNPLSEDAYSSAAIYLTMFIGIGLLLIAAVFSFSGVDLFPKYLFNNYIILISLIAVTSNMQQVIINIYRVKQKIFWIVLVELSSAILLTLFTFVFKNGDVINSQLIVMASTQLVNVAILLINFPLKLKKRVDFSTNLSLIKMGIPLLVYNLSFYLITIVARTIISIFYSTEKLGYFTLANSISSATLLGLQSVAWVLYPKVLAKTSDHYDHEAASNTLNRINQTYIPMSFLLVNLVILVFPLVFIALPQYKSSLTIIYPLVISQAILSSSYGFNSMAISRGKQKEVASVGMLVVLLVTLMSVYIGVNHFSEYWIAFIVFIGSFLYTFTQIYICSTLILKRKSFWREVKTVFPWGLLLSIVLNLFAGFTSFPMMISALATVIFIFFERNKLIVVFKYVRKKLIS